MSFVSKALGGGGSGASQQRASQQTQVNDLRNAQTAQSDKISERAAATDAAEKAQRRIRSGRRRGLLAYTDDSLGTTFGGGG